jgi:uncharacterized protein YcbK (DUF882 family)
MLPDIPGKVRRGIPKIAGMFALLQLAILAGCVSPVEPVLGSAASFAPSTQQTSDIPLAVAATSPTGGETDTFQNAGQNAGQQKASDAAMDQPAEQVVASTGKVAVPAPAPRDASTLTAEGSALAFATTDETASAGTGAVLAASGETTGSVASGSAISDAGTPPAPAGTAKKQSLYAMLQKQKAERDSARTTQGTSTKPQPAGPAAKQGGAANDLPGVSPDAGAPFELLPRARGGGQFPGHEDAEDEDGFEPYEVASAGSMARLSPNGILLQSEKVEVGCFDPALTNLLKAIETHYGRPVLVTSGYRSPRANRRAGGASHSMHIQCKAADIQVAGVSKWDLAKYLRTVEGRGGVGTYCRTNSVHIDVGPEREWHHPCRRAKKRA